VMLAEVYEEDTAAVVRAAAAEALGRAAVNKALQADLVRFLLDAMDDGNCLPADRGLAARGIGFAFVQEEMPQEVFDELMQAFASDVRELATGAIEGLRAAFRQRPPPDILVSKLLEHLLNQDDCSQVRVACAESFGQIAESRDLPEHVFAALRSPLVAAGAGEATDGPGPDEDSWMVRRSAMAAIAKASRHRDLPQDVIDALVDRLEKDERKENRIAAASALGVAAETQSLPRSAVEALERARKGGDGGLRQAANRAWDAALQEELCC